ncbi:MAG: hypothetical protein JKY19_02210 [Alcanivoracaceae bacterium]|nr:hypothetical protein [Alcanivoracaceae bacterium]
MSLTNKFSISIFSVLLFLVSFAANAGPAGVTLDLSFTPDTIGPGSTSRLNFTFTNIDTVVVTDIAVTDVLPMGVTIATPANVVSSCIIANVVAPDGGGTITIDNASLGVSESCTVAVNVTSTIPGLHMNTTGDVTSSAGNNGTASANITVVTDRPGFSKSFSPSTVTLGSPSTLSFTVNNSSNGGFALAMMFTDILPAGMIVASPNNANTDCNFFSTAVITAVSGSNSISLISAGVAAGLTCTVNVDVVAGAVGVLNNQSGELLSLGIGSGFAVATLDVNIQPVILEKDFIDDPVAPGGTTTLSFTILNTDRNNATSNMTFTDNLDAALSGMVALSLPQSNVCGAGSMLTGSGLISLTGGNLPAEGSCTFDVTVQVPTMTVAGEYPNTTGSLTGLLGVNPFTTDPAVSNLFVQPIPVFTKTFTDDPIGAGSDVTLEFTITNSSLTSAATAISFLDELTTFLPFPVAVTLPPVPNPPCGAGSALSLVLIDDDGQGLSLTGGNLTPNGMLGDSCTFSVDISLPADFPGGIYTNTTEAINATVDGVIYTGLPATDDMVVVAAPQLTKEFTNDPVQSGTIVNMQLTLSHEDFAVGDATGITFTDDLNAALTGLSATGLPMMDICGVGSQITGTTNLTFTGGTLVPGESCTFNISLQVPVAAVSGNYTNTTSDVTATVMGIVANGNAGADVLTVANVLFSKVFLDNPIQPGGTTILEFTVENLSAFAVTDIFFTDNLGAFGGALSGLASTSVVSDTCGGTPLGVPGTLFIYSGGTLLANQTCTIQIDLTVPAMTANGNYTNVTSNLTATINANPVLLNLAIASLEVTSDLLLFAKSFIDDPVAPGELVTLEFTLGNVSTTDAASAIGFSDDLGAALTGFTYTSELSNTCGGTVAGVGTTLITFSGGTLPASGSCTIQVSLTVPLSAPTSIVTNTTSIVTGTINSLPADGPAASDDLFIDLVTFTKQFDGPSTATGTPVMTYTITNLDSSQGVIDLFFNDDLDAVITGLEATGLPVSNTCGATSSLAGTSLLTFTDGQLPPGGSCDIVVNLLVPVTAVGGTFPSSSGDLFVAGLAVATSATDDLEIEPAPGFTKVFDPGFIGLNQSSIINFDIDNTASDLAANNLQFTDNLPAGMVLDTSPVIANTCGGTLTANNGGAVVSLANGSVAVTGSCNIQVRVIGVMAGAHVNTTLDLTSSSGNSGIASDTLTVNSQPLFSKVFGPNPIFFNGVSTLTFTIDNSSGTVAATALNFVDNLPTNMQVAAAANASTTCTGGMLNAASGTSLISYASGSVSTGAVCTVTVDVTTSVSGSFVNLTGNLSSSLGVSATATDTLVVNAPPQFAKQFNPVALSLGDISQLTFTIDNSQSSVNATSVDFTDNFPANLVVATPANASTTCVGGTVTAVATTTVFSYTGGTVTAGTSCTLVVDVTSAVAANYVNLTGDLTSNHGNSGQATDSLFVTNAPIFSKAFANNPAVLNSVNTLTFSIDNSGNLFIVGLLDFTDVMPAGFEVANPANVANTCTGGTVTATIASNTITYAGGSVGASSSCTIAVDVVATMTGFFTNTTGDLTSDQGSSGAASADITIVAVPALSKEFLGGAITAGDTVELSFNLSNISPVDASFITFSDDLTAFIPGSSVISLPPNDVCGAGSSVTGTTTILLQGGFLPANSSCQFSVIIEVPDDVVAGQYTNVTSPVDAELNGLAVSGGASSTASGNLIVNGIPVLIPIMQDWKWLSLLMFAMLLMVAVFNKKQFKVNL